MPVDQQTWRRIARTGLTALDLDKACPGYFVYSPYNGDGEGKGLTLLCDINGNELHRWYPPTPPGSWGYLLPNGNLFYMAKSEQINEGNMPATAFVGGWLVELDWDSNIIWEHHNPAQHHDARRTNNGGAMFLTLEVIPTDLVGRVRGGQPDSSMDADHEGGATETTHMWADHIIEVDANGTTIWDWHAYEHLSIDKHIITDGEPRHEWSHGNTVVPISDDKVLASFRNISTVMMIDKVSGNILWEIGDDVISRQHDPSLLPNGNILIFDNGERRKNDVRIFSRVVEINPDNGQVTWEYRDTPYFNFYSSRISGARRMTNGNTLITEGMFGRMFQVTQSGEVVWEYINPYFPKGQDGYEDNRVFRCSWYMEGEIPQISHS
jgi:hypothetical protein